MGKRALLVGINYPGTKAELKGCINDVNRMHKCLINRYGFAEEDIVVLIDTDSKYPQPTGVNIRRALSDLVASAEPGDYLFFHYSGHGTRLPAETGDDDDTGYDECIVPCDMNLITDQDFKELVLKVPDGCVITIVSDSCHSGGLLDKAKEQIGESTKLNREESNSESPSGGFRSFLKGKVKDAVHDAFQSRGIDIPDEILHRRHHNSSYEPEEVEEREHAGGHVKSRSLPLSTLIEMLKENSGKDDVDVGNIRPTLYHMFGKDASPKFKKFMKVLFKRLQEGRLSEGGGGHGGIIGLLSGVAHEVLKIKDDKEDEEVEVETEEEVYAGTKKNLPNNGVLISGCQTDQTSADANTPNGAYGACSNAIQAIIAENDGEVTNKDLVLNVRKMLGKEGYTQKPGLYCTDKHLNYPFIC
ncbi:Metacaspase 8 [Rhynchospora pubera]|uniref:Metacaspase 8 n=1 Tax=Rhynchospora pubera TaxID=906938 RepID=A0AAV8CFK9_9POAL|nr:Metacaspase 8 [Rhynchospora pubera]